MKNVPEEAVLAAARAMFPRLFDSEADNVPTPRTKEEAYAFARRGLDAAYPTIKTAILFS